MAPMQKSMEELGAFEHTIYTLLRNHLMPGDAAFILTVVMHRLNYENMKEYDVEDAITLFSNHMRALDAERKATQQ